MLIRASTSVRGATARLARAGHLPSVLAAALPGSLTSDRLAGAALVVDPALAAALIRLSAEHEPAGALTPGGEICAATPRSRPTGRPGFETSSRPGRTPGARVGVAWPAPGRRSVGRAASHHDHGGSVAATRPLTLLVPDRIGGSGDAVREAGAGPSRLARHVHALIAAVGGRWPPARGGAPEIANGDVPVRVTADEQVAAQLRALVAGRADEPVAAIRRSAPGSSPTPPTAATPTPTAVVTSVTAAAAVTSPAAAPRHSSPDGLAALVEWWDGTTAAAQSLSATAPSGSVRPPSRDSEHRLRRVTPGTVLRIGTPLGDGGAGEAASDPLAVFRDALEQVLLDEALADGLAVT